MALTFFKQIKQEAAIYAPQGDKSSGKSLVTASQTRINAIYANSRKLWLILINHTS